MLPRIEGNAIITAKTPFFDHLVSEHQAISLHASGEAVGLPWGEMGNSEVGHLNIGAGRVVLQDFPQISRTIRDGSFFRNSVLTQAVDHVKRHQSRLHLLGLVSKGAVHAHIDHLYGLLALAKRSGVKEVFVHAILDGRDAPARSAAQYIAPLLAWMGKENIGQLATMVGRYYAMDRDHRSDRIKVAYEALVEGKGTLIENPVEALEQAYRKGGSDEFMEPLIRGTDSRVKANDAVIFYNFRADRAIALTKAFVDDHFQDFNRKLIENIFFVTMTNYEHNLRARVAFSPIMLNDPTSNPLSNCLSEMVSMANLGQLHIAETEKYAHVTYFFNSGHQSKFELEEQILIPSPKVATYDKTPEMSLPAIVEEFKKSFTKNLPALSIINFANADMVGHTGDFKATVDAIEAIDRYLADVVSFSSSQGAAVMITADHGNAEQMINPVTSSLDKEHTVNPVPFIIVENKVATGLFNSIANDKKITFHATKPVGIFADVGPTILDYLGLPPAPEMTGTSLRGLI